MAAGELSLGYLDYVMQPPPVVDRTYSQAADELGIKNVSRDVVVHEAVRA